MRAFEFLTEATSEWISHLEYDAETFTCTMHLLDGRRYFFYDVPENVYKVWDSVPSAGTFYHRMMKGNYEDTVPSNKTLN